MTNAVNEINRTTPAKIFNISINKNLRVRNVKKCCSCSENEKEGRLLMKVINNKGLHRLFFSGIIKFSERQGTYTLNNENFFLRTSMNILVLFTQGLGQGVGGGVV
jgi:hypothetical protein